MLKTSDAKIGLVSDPEIFETIDRGIRGGICAISKRYARANNPYLGSEYYDPKLPTSFITYLDANNLYGWAMRQPLACGNVKWVDPSVASAMNEGFWLKQNDQQRIGFIIVCDLDYPAELHDDHNDYPLAAERINIDLEMLSDAQLVIRTAYEMSRASDNVKLVLTFSRNATTVATTSCSSSSSSTAFDCAPFTASSSSNSRLGYPNTST